MEVERLRYMANQIARNLAALGEDAAVAAMVRHIEDFWDPRMKAAILNTDGRGLDLIASRAIGELGASSRSRSASMDQ